MSEASEYIADLVEFGKHDYADLSSVELGEVATLMYLAASNEERRDMILDSRGSEDFFSLLAPVVLDTCDMDYALALSEQAIKCLIETTEMRTKEMLRFAVDDLEENNRLQQQDSEYVEFKESDL